MAIYFTWDKIVDLDIGDDVAMAEMPKRRQAAPVPVAVDWDCFANEVMIENTLSVLYAIYSRIDKLMIVVPRIAPPPPIDPPAGVEGEEGEEEKSYWYFAPAPPSQNLVFDWRDVRWSVIKNYIHHALRDHEGLCSSLHTTLRMSGSGRCYHEDDGGECQRKRSCGSDGTCSMPIICVMEVTQFPDVTPVPYMTPREQMRLWTEATAPAPPPHLAVVIREEEEDDTPDLVDPASLDPEWLAQRIGWASSSQQQTQTSAGSYLVDVHCGKTTIWGGR